MALLLTIRLKTTANADLPSPELMPLRFAQSRHDWLSIGRTFIVEATGARGPRHLGR